MYIKIKMFNKIFSFTSSVQKFYKEVPNIEVDKWYRFPWDSTDKVRLCKTPMTEKIICSKCKKEINGFVWDVYIVCIAFINYKFDLPICTNCAPDLQSVLNMYDPKLHPELK